MHRLHDSTNSILLSEKFCNAFRVILFFDNRRAKLFIFFTFQVNFVTIFLCKKGCTTVIVKGL